MKARSLALALILLVPTPGSAQTTTADGIRAISSGDYTTAARILRPFAEDQSNPDPVAQFFLGILYHTGEGVQFNRDRSCGLFLAAAKPENPFSPQALALAQSTHQDHPLARAVCEATRPGSWRNPPEQMYSFAEDHWVRMDENGLTVGYRGQQKKFRTGWGGPGWVFLPMRYTETRAADSSVKRHFMEFFFWTPALDNRNVWTLVWSVFEVVGADAFHAPGDDVVATVLESRPPSIDPTEIGRIVVSLDGAVERAVFGANPRTMPIPLPETR
jgi:hypothetical protein